MNVNAGAFQVFVRGVLDPQGEFDGVQGEPLASEPSSWKNPLRKDQAEAMAWSIASTAAIIPQA